MNIPHQQIRRTKIIGTLGPSCEGRDLLSEMILAGMDIARLNLSHGSERDHNRQIAEVRQAADALHKIIAVMVDIPGPKLRVGSLPGGERELKTGDLIILGSEHSEPGVIPIGPDEYIPPVEVGDEILLADGAASLRVSEVGRAISATVQAGGIIHSGAGVVIPGRRPDIPYLNAYLLKNLKTAAGMNPDFIALSFVGSAEDIRDARKILLDCGIAVPLIAKIETKTAVDNFDAILSAADGIMVARGDLGVELPIQQVPYLQKEIIRRTNRAGKPVITATEMLESMIHQGRPTRAEANDVATAIIEGTDATMLSGETSIGAYPVRAVSMMAEIALATELHLPYRKILEDRGSWRDSVSVGSVVSYNACFIADELSAAALVAYTRSGLTAERVSACRPRTLILAISPDMQVCRRLLLWWGVIPSLHTPIGTADELFSAAVQIAKRTRIGSLGENLVIIAGNFSGQQGTTSMIQVQEIA